MRKLLLLLLLLPLNGWGAWGHIAAGTWNCQASDKTAGTSVACTPLATIAAGSVVVCIVSADNDGDGIADDIDSVSDTVNSYSEATEFERDPGAADAGASVAIYYSVLGTELTTSSTITANFARSVPASALGCVGQTIGAGSTVSVAGTPQTEGTSVDAGSLTLSGLASSEYLFIRAIASETDISEISATTASYADPWGRISTTGGGEASNMGIGGERRILTGTGDSSDPTMADTSADRASVYVALLETAGGGGGTTHPGWRGPSGWF